MFRNLDKFFSSRPLWQLILGGLVLVVVMGLIDYVSGFEVSVSVFYLIPIALSSWYGGSHVGLLLCVASGITWFFVEYFSGHLYSQAWILFWNATVRLTFFCVTAYLFAKLREHLKREEMWARLDALTGLRNSRSFKEEAGLLFRLAARYKHPLVLGYIDLDNFKTVNDTMGHSEGDQVLQTVGRTLSLAVRSTDIVGRLGGDEFAILLPHADASGAKAFFDKLRERLLKVAGERGWPIGFSIGVAIFSGVPPNEIDALKYADVLMYRVKNSGKNSVIYGLFPGGETEAQRVTSR